LDVAIYGFRLADEAERLVAGALEDAAKRGVAVRLAFNEDHRKAVPVPPPPEGDPSTIDELEVPTRGIPGVPDLMHHNYVLRDGAAVWSGSTNWTLHSGSRQEHAIVPVDSPAVS